MNHLSKLIYFALLSVLMSAPAAIAATAPQPAKGSAAKATPAQAAPVASPAPVPQQPQPAMAGAAASPFNRLMKVAPRRHLPPPEDGLRDPTNVETALLQPPLEVYASLPKSQGDLGNGINWVAALNDGKIKPRWDRNDPTAEPMVMDMSVVRVPKGTMPDVVFPHKQHTEWLDCSNCHPAIFVPQKGANQMNMAAIILGQKCGVCHGKVAFPVSECRRCHSQPKQVAAKGPQP
ncbi:MAG: cytochrome c, class I [Gallionella sp.]|nr:MAG: cytochrome c, class I [Gallionella sp.]